MKPVIVSVTTKTSKENIWKALTNAEEMRKWFFDNIPDFKPEVGFTTEFNVVSNERNFLHVWKVSKVTCLQELVCLWQYPEYLKDTFEVKFKVDTNDNAENIITVSAIGIEKFEHLNLPEFTRESCKGGWEYFMNRLKVYLEKHK